MIQPKRHYGPVSCEIDDNSRTIKFLIKRYANPLPDKTIIRCVRWAITDLHDMVEAGYSFDMSGLDLEFQANL